MLDFIQNSITKKITYVFRVNKTYVCASSLSELRNAALIHYGFDIITLLN